MIAIFTNIKNENKYLAQWIEYHANLGFDEFILFEDEGSEPHDDIIMQFSGKVNITLYKDVLKNDNTEFKDLTCFNFVFKYHPEITWGIKLDPDEYIYLNKWNTIQEYITFCEKCGQTDELIISWKIYNANGNVFAPDGLYDLNDMYPNSIAFEDIVPDESLHTSNNTYNLAKTLLRFTAFPDRSDAVINANIAPCFPHQLLLTENPVDCTTNDDVYIKHFITKSFDEYFNRLKNKGEYSPQWFRTLGDFFMLNPDMKELIPQLEKEFNFSIDTFTTKLNVSDVKYQ